MAIEGLSVAADTPALSAETQALADKARGVGGNETLNVPITQPTAITARPDDVPEKFWDVEKGQVNTAALLKSYSELERKNSSPKAEGEEPEPAEPTNPDSARLAAQKPKEGAEEKPDEPAAALTTEALTSAITDAQRVYVETGDLSAEARGALVKAGIPEVQLDLYIQGIKAQEKALAAEVYGIAGSEDEYRAAAAWALKNWSEEEIAAFDAAVGNPKLMRTAVKGLMADFGSATPPDEGRLHNTNTAAVQGDTYSNRDEFLQDLRKADEGRDQVARRKAIEKLQRSRAAGTIKEVGSRTGPFRR